MLFSRSKLAQVVLIVAILGGTAAVAQEPHLDCTQNPGILHPIFNDHMVLQRNVLLPVWGCTNPGGAVTVSIAGQTARTTASASGFWKLRLKAIQAGGPYSMVVNAVKTRVLSDVLIGDVWLCAGQSNMGLQVKNASKAAQEIDQSVKYPDIRLLKLSNSDGASQPRQVFFGNPKWQVANPASVPDFSAVCYFFGRELAKNGPVPQGLITAVKAPSVIEWWMSAESLADDPEFADEIANFADGRYPASVPYTTSVFNGTIAPLTPFPLRGIAWYQGESKPGLSARYGRLLPKLIRDWRSRFGFSDGPFFVVQFPRYGPPQSEPSENNGWVRMREAQYQTALNVPNVGLAVTIDTGREDTIHPLAKQDVGSRLASLARGFVYHRPVAAEGPLYRSMSVEGTSIRISFYNAAQGLMVGSKQPLEPVVELPYGQLSAFAIAGADRTFVWAKARIEGSTVVVSAPEVASPVAVRYGWARNPNCNLYGKDGLPASPFRTDSW